MNFTTKQQVFIDEYLKCFNATEAARRAEYAFPNVEGSKNLVKPSIKEEIDARLAERTLKANEVLDRLSEQAKGEHSHYLQPNGEVDLGALLADGKGHLVKKIKPTKEGLEIEFYDAQSALTLLGRHYQLFTDKIEHSGGIQIEYVNDWRDIDRGED